MGAKGVWRRGGGADDDVAEITTAPTSRAEEMRHRQRRYLFSMGVRTICFVGAIVAHGWLRWGLVGGALVLPYVAVVMANAASPQVPGTGPEPPGPPTDRPMLPPGGGTRG